MKEYKLTIDNVYCGSIVFDDYKVTTLMSDGSKYLSLFLNDREVYHIGNKKYISVLDNSKNILIDSFK